MNKDLQGEIKLDDNFEIVIYENKEDQEKGIIKSRTTAHNKMTNVSLAVISGLVGNTGSQTAFTYGALGTSAAAVSAADTALTAEIVDSGLQRTSAAMSRSTTTQTNDTLVFTLTWTASGSKTLNEFGAFNAASGVIMLSRVLTGSQAVVSGNVVNVTYSLKFVGN